MTPDASLPRSPMPTLHAVIGWLELTELTVNEAIRRWPGTIAVFNRHGIDACCGGAVPIRAAAERDGASADAVVVAIARVVRSGALP